MDLMVLADALLLPGDDLALATVLKSPLFGLDDGDLFEIAWERKGALRTALRAKAHRQPRFADAAAKLDRFADWAAHMLPFAFYARVLGPKADANASWRGSATKPKTRSTNSSISRSTMRAGETPSLQGFMGWLRTAKTEVKRDMEITRDEVRVMTVHGAKGLEARIVILADTAMPPAGPDQRQPRLLTLAAEGAAHSSGGFVGLPTKAYDVAPVGAARERARREAEEEYRRLLYVAMTRAIDRLVICGPKASAGCPTVAGGAWHSLPCSRYRSRNPPTTVTGRCGAARRTVDSPARRPGRLFRRWMTNGPPGSTVMRPPSRQSFGRSRRQAPTTKQPWCAGLASATGPNARRQWRAAR